MKNKQLKYFLIILVLMVWSLIVIKLFHFIKPESENIEIVNDETMEKSNNKDKDTFLIIADYPDPFLKRSKGSSSVKTVSSDIRKKENNKTISLPNVRWPNLVYSGFVSDNTGSKSSILLTIDGVSFIMQKGEKNKEVEVLIITKDSLKVKFSDMTKYIKRYENRK